MTPEFSSYKQLFAFDNRPDSFLEGVPNLCLIQINIRNIDMTVTSLKLYIVSFLRCQNHALPMSRNRNEQNFDA